MRSRHVPCTAPSTTSSTHLAIGEADANILGQVQLGDVLLQSQLARRLQRRVGWPAGERVGNGGALNNVQGQAGHVQPMDAPRPMPHLLHCLAVGGCCGILLLLLLQTAIGGNGRQGHRSQRRAARQAGWRQPCRQGRQQPRGAPLRTLTLNSLIILAACYLCCYRA